jgi:hypothetical protein
MVLILWFLYETVFWMETLRIEKKEREKRIKEWVKESLVNGKKEKGKFP